MYFEGFVVSEYHFMCLFVCAGVNLFLWCLSSEFQAELADGKMPETNAPLPSHTAAGFASTSKSNIPLKKGMSTHTF